MNNKTIKEYILEDYKKKYLENAKRLDYKDILNENYIETHLYKDLQNVEVNGFPFASDRNENGELTYHFIKPNYHELYVGTTGSGKTTGCVEPQLRAMTSIKNKPNLFITDPKGELFERNSAHLKRMGYRIFILNFKDIFHSDRWNPLLEIYDSYNRLKSVGKNIKVNKLPIKDGLTLASNKEEYTESYVEYNNIAFVNNERCLAYITFEKDLIEGETEDLIQQLIPAVIMNVQNEKDPVWREGARRILQSILWAMLEESISPSSGFTRDMFTIKTIHEYFMEIYTTHSSYDSSGGYPSISSLPLYKNKPKDAKSVTYLVSTYESARVTAKGYFSTFESSTMKWFNAKLKMLTTGNTIELESKDDTPFAIFIATRDYEDSDFQVAGLFIDWVYRKMIEKFEKSPETSRAMHFFLDEFGNIPPIRAMASKIATARSRNIWFHLIVQSYSQISNVYDSDSSKAASIILDNCNSKIFLGAENQDSKEFFSKQCGIHNVESISSFFDSNVSFVETRVLPISSLDLIKPGEVFVKRVYMPLITSKFIRSYLCPEFKEEKGSHLSLLPFNDCSINSSKYSFVKRKKETSYNKNFLY